MTQKELSVVPKITQIDTDQVSKEITSAEPEEVKAEVPDHAASRLRPELREAVNASWEQNKEAYRYLGG